MKPASVSTAMPIDLLSTPVGRAVEDLWSGWNTGICMSAPGSRRSHDSASVRSRVALVIWRLDSARYGH